MPKRDHLISIKALANRWVVAGKPNSIEFEKKHRVSRKRFQKASSDPFWETAVLYAEREIEKAEEDGDMPSGERLNKDLVKQAVVLRMCGWDFADIARAVNRNRRQMFQWKKTKVWRDIAEEVLLDKILMHLIYKGSSAQDFLDSIDLKKYD